jgi:ABC-2 type transport system permease protein
MNTLGATRLVAGRELRETFRRKSYWIVTAVLLLGSTAAMVLPSVLGSDERPRFDVVLVGSADDLGDPLIAVADRLGVDIDVETTTDESAALHDVEEERADLAVVPGDPPRFVVRADEDDRLLAAASQSWADQELVTRLTAAGLESADIERALDVPTPRVDEVDEANEGRRTAAFAVSFVLYLLLLSLMVQVANAVAVEKSNRISEVLLPVVRPGALLFGKVIGVCIVGVLTLAAVAAPVVVRLVVGGDLPEGIAATLGASVVWFVLGLALYLTIAGSLGALAERQEQAGSVVAPLTFLLIATFIAAQSAGDTVLGVFLAIFPFTSPLMMPFRVAIGESNTIEIIASLVVLVGTVAAAGAIGSTIYSRAIVRTGRRLTLREALQSDHR